MSLHLNGPSLNVNYNWLGKMIIATVHIAD